MNEAVFVVISVPLALFLPPVVAVAYYKLARRQPKSPQNSKHLLAWLASDLGFATFIALVAGLLYLDRHLFHP